MMTGVTLVAEGIHFEIPKGYIYFSMAFAFLVDIIQMKTIKQKNTEAIAWQLVYSSSEVV
jgi:predicted tellurium resistance membrane protein TerC